MQDATITSDAPPGDSQGGFPSVLTTEDLYTEMGRQVATVLNLERLIKRLAGRIQVAEKAAADGKLSVEKAAEVAQSNKALSEQNQALDQELTKARIRATEAEKARDNEQKAALEAQATLLKVRTELDSAQEQIKKLKAPKKRKKARK